MSSSFTQISLVLKKELVTSLRDRSSWATMLMFSLVTLSAVSLALRGAIPSPTIAAALLWVILFFSSMAGIGNIFTSESASGTLLALRIYGSANAVLFGKFFYTLILLIVMSLFTVPLFIIFIGVSVSETLIFIISIVLGVWGIASAGTLTAAIMMATDGKGGGLFSILMLPVILPVFLPAIALTAFSFGGDAASVKYLGAMLIYDLLITVAASMLFDFLWYEESGE